LPGKTCWIVIPDLSQRWTSLRLLECFLYAGCRFGLWGALAPRLLKSTPNNNTAIQNSSTKKYKMKAKTIILMLSGLVAGSMAVSAQDYLPLPAANAATQDSAAAAPAVAQADPAPAVAQADPTPAVAQAAPAPASAPDDPMLVPAQAAPAPVLAQADSAPVLAQADSAPAPAPTDSGAQNSAATAQSTAVIPLIVMDDVPLTDAIKNLARQANLNYMLDPKISYGQVGPDGKLAPQPTVAIRWENITAAQALNALLNNYGLQLVPDAKTKIARVTTQDPAAALPLFTRIVKLNYASPSNILGAVQSSLTDKRSKVIGDTRSSQLVLVGTERELDEADKLIVQLDTPTKQVLIEARIMETSLNPKSVKGINWAGTLQAQHLAVGNNLQVNPPSSSVNNTLTTSGPKMLFDTAKGFNPATAFLDADGVNATLSFLDTDNMANTIATPHAVTLDNEMASLEVIQQFPVVNVTAGTANTTGGSSISYTNVGVKLHVTPHISANNYVSLKVLPEVSNHESDISFSVGPGSLISVPIFNRRTIETTVLIPSGFTLVLGGLVSDRLTTAATKVPFLGDIPGLGRAFRSDTKERTKANLLIFITPTIVQDSDFQPHKDNFLKTPVTSAEESEWNDKKPFDWSSVASQQN
jgi:type II secretory pathway component GspD/PulD (secretin)